jgi:hypothetical protein
MLAKQLPLLTDVSIRTKFDDLGSTMIRGEGLKVLCDNLALTALDIGTTLLTKVQISMATMN